MNIFEKFSHWIRHFDEREKNGEFSGGIKVVFRIFVLFYRFIQITIREFLDDRLFMYSMALTFCTMLTLVPILAVSFSIFKLFGGGQWFTETLRPILLRSLAPGSGPIIAGKIEALLVKGSDTTWGGISLVLLVLVVFGIFSAIEKTFNNIWGVSGNSGSLYRLPHYWGLMTIIPMLILSSLAFTTYLTALPLVHEAIERVSSFKSVANSMLPGIIILIGFFLLYRFLPNTRVRTYSALTGAAIATLFYELFKSIFIFYTGKVVHYDVVYGSLAIIPLLMVWINLSWVVVLLGVEISFVIQHFNVLLDKGKHIEFSRPQKDMLAYQILFQVTQAFRGKRPPVSLGEWSHQYGIPPAILEETFDQLRNGGIVMRTGERGEKLLLTRDPDFIHLNDIGRILSGEAQEKWKIPNDSSWRWMKNWFQEYCLGHDQAGGNMTLGKLVELMESGITKIR